MLRQVVAGSAWSRPQWMITTRLGLGPNPLGVYMQGQLCACVGLYFSALVGSNREAMWGGRPGWREGYVEIIVVAEGQGENPGACGR